MRYFIVDAFADQVFSGNQAGVCLLDSPLSAQDMQQIAAENNLAETAFLAKRGPDYALRWFTPEMEMDLCGHATLASAYVIANFVDPMVQTMRFHTRSGPLTVTQNGDLLEMDFPARKPAPTQLLPLMEKALGCPVLEAHLSRDLLLVLPNEAAVQNLQPDMHLLAQIPGCFAVIATAKGDSADFVSRFFAPGAGIPEDPVTGSAHASLIPFWAPRLGKTSMVARQLSKRGGTLYCEDCGDRVKISGKAALYLSGEILSEPMMPPAEDPYSRLMPE